jgi:hypothetical protein
MEHVPGFGATPRYEVESLAGTTRVMNIEVGDDFNDEKLSELKMAMAEYKRLGVFKTKEELDDYEGAIRTIERIINARKRLKEEEESKKVLH